MAKPHGCECRCAPALAAQEVVWCSQAEATSGKRQSVATQLVMRLIGLDYVANTLVIFYLNVIFLNQLTLFG
jgi:hypothetical protein